MRQLLQQITSEISVWDYYSWKKTKRILLWCLSLLESFGKELIKKEIITSGTKSFFHLSLVEIVTLRVFLQKTPHVITQAVLKGILWLFSSELLENSGHSEHRLKWSLKHASPHPTKPSLSGWNNKFLGMGSGQKHATTFSINWIFFLYSQRHYTGVAYWRDGSTIVHQ